MKDLKRTGAGDGTRTRDLLITNQLLYQLSYAGQLLVRKSEFLPCLGEPGQSTLIVKNEKGVFMWSGNSKFKYWESNQLPIKRLQKPSKKT